MFRSAPSQSLSQAFRRLRFGVILSCWIVGLAVAMQLVIWSLATFTQLRFDVVEANVEAPLVVTPEQSRARLLRNATESDLGLPSVLTSPPPRDGNKQAATEARLAPSLFDAQFARFFELASGAGILAAITLVLMITLGVLLAVSSATHGADRTVSAFIWAVVLGAMILPLGRMLNLPWENGALTTYAHMTEWVDRVNPPPDPNPPDVTGSKVRDEADQFTSNAASLGETLKFYARFGLLPLTCIVGLVVVGVRFNAGIDAGIIPRESMRLDPKLEREASNIAPTSLHGGRSAAILNQTLDRPQEEPAESGSMVTSAASLRQLSAGDAPRRLI